MNLIKKTIHLLRFLIFPITKYKSHYNISLVIHYQPPTFGFGFLSIFWLGTAGIALYKIKQRQVEQHRKWMIRNYSLTFAAVTLRVWLLVFILLAGIENYITSYTIISWLCWIPNLLIAEFYLKKPRNIVRNQE